MRPNFLPKNHTQTSFRKRVLEFPLPVTNTRWMLGKNKIVSKSFFLESFTSGPNGRSLALFYETVWKCKEEPKNRLLCALPPVFWPTKLVTYRNKLHHVPCVVQERSPDTPDTYLTYTFPVIATSSDTYTTFALRQELASGLDDFLGLVDDYFKQEELLQAYCEQMT